MLFFAVILVYFTSRSCLSPMGNTTTEARDWGEGAPVPPLSEKSWSQACAQLFADGANIVLHTDGASGRGTRPPPPPGCASRPPPGTHWHQGRSRRQRPVNIGHGGAGSFPGVVVVVISFGPRCGGVQGELPWYHRAPLGKSFPGAPREHSPRGDHFECYHARERSGHLLHEHY